MANNKKQKKKHVKGHDDSCHVCEHSDRDTIEDMYLRWSFGGKKAPLARAFKLNRDHLDSHVEATGLQARRTKNTEELAGALLDMKMEELDPSEVTVPELVKLIKHTDVKEGRVVHKVRDDRPPTIQVVASPAPGAAPPLSSSNQDGQGRLLPPTFEAEVLEIPEKEKETEEQGE